MPLDRALINCGGREKDRESTFAGIDKSAEAKKTGRPQVTAPF
jgi:hypothetical protein